MRLSLSRSAVKTIVATIAAIASLTVLFLFSERSITPLWEGYRVFAFPLAEDEQRLISALEGEHIASFVTESNSSFAVGNEMSPILPFLERELNAWTAWFRNERAGLRYIYVEETPFLETRAQKAFSGCGFDWFLEHTEETKLIPIIFVALFFALAIVASRHRPFLIVAGFPYLLLAFSSNRFPGYISALFSIAFVFLLGERIERDERIMLGEWRRLRALLFLWIAAPFFLAILSSVLGGVATVTVFLASCILALALYELFVAIKRRIEGLSERKRLHPRFRPRRMMPYAPSSRLPPRREILVGGAACALLLPGLFAFSASGIDALSLKKNDGAASIGFQELYIPAPSGYTAPVGFDAEGYTALIQARAQERLPDLGDYLALRWNVDTAPWRRVQDSVPGPKAGDTVESTEYFADERGVISGKTRILYTFDTNYMRKTLASVSSPLERMLVRQGRFMAVGVSSRALRQQK